MVVDIIRLVAGLIMLIVAADRLVISAVRIAKVLNISVIIIGAVIVGFGTSVPEFVVSALAASQGNLDLAMSNVVASNTANLTLVLGVAALLATVATMRAVVRREGLLMLFAVLALSLVLIGQEVTRLEGVALIIGMGLAIVLLIRWARELPNESTDELEDIKADPDRLWIEVLYGFVALVVTIVAGHQLLTGVEGIGETLGFSVVLMGLITGVGTSLPELSAAIAGARRGHSDLVLGNVLGSNIFNSLGVAGLAAVIGPGSLSGVTWVLLVVMLGAAVFAGVFAFSQQVISRREGIILIAMFVLFALASS
ncbi:MAG: sodium:calcium antiporter [Acidimicrobiia bacterium]